MRRDVEQRLSAIAEDRLPPKAPEKNNTNTKMASNGDQTRASGSEFTTKPLFMVCSRAQPLFFKRTPDSLAAAAIFKKCFVSRCDGHRIIA